MRIPTAKRMKAVRKTTGLSQRLFGIECGIDPAYAAIKLSKYENDKHTPSYDLLCAISDKFKVPVSYFYERDDNIAEMLLEYHKPKTTK